MRIISKYKDYYDWVVFETDNRKVYNRIESKVEFPSMYISPWDKMVNYTGQVYFCNKQYSFLTYNGVYYWDSKNIPEDVARIIIKDTKKYWNKSKSDLSYLHLGLMVKDKTNEPVYWDLNIRMGAPVILSYDNSKTYTLNPKLSDIGFAKIVSPTEAYQDIYNWIPYIEPELPGPPEDMSRYEAKGFDKKTSFRPKMKDK